MDTKFLELYNQELKYIREVGGEFSKEYPKIAGRLGLEGFDCSDPYVERLLEGFAFLSARIHQKLDASFPKFTQHMMELMFPTFLMPSPSMLISQFHPDYEEGSLVEGVVIPKHTALHGLLNKGEQTACEYRTAHDVTLWPISITNAEYINAQAIAAYTQDLSHPFEAKSGILLTLQVPNGVKFSDLALDSLELYIRGTESFPHYLFEAMYKGFQGCFYKDGKNNWRIQEQETSIKSQGLSSEEALLPVSNKQFDAFRLLKEFFLMPNRFLFLAIDQLNATLRNCHEEKLQLLIVLDHNEAKLEHLVSKENFSLFCTPAINLFPKKAERINVSRVKNEFHVVPDRIRPLDFEVCSVTHVNGFSTGVKPSSTFLPLYGSHLSLSDESNGYYAVERRIRNLSTNQKKFGHRSSYIGSELFMTITDPKHPPFSDDLKQLSVETLCCNRDLPLMMPLGKSKTDFTIETGAPCESVRCVGEPTKPKPPLSQGNVTWDLINHLSINYLGLSHNDGRTSLSAIKSLLRLLMDKNDFSQDKLVEGIVDVSIKQTTARIPIAGPICYGRGVEINIHVDELAYEGSSVFLLGLVFDQFFAQYVSINSFSQLVLHSQDRGEIHRWPIRIGSRSPI